MGSNPQLRLFWAAAAGLSLLISACSSLDRTVTMAPLTEKKEPIEILDCQSTREFITTYRYLEKEQDHLGMSEKEIQRVADNVSAGCTGAASRFVRSFEMLSQVEIGSRTALRVALALSKREDARADAFIEVFKRAYLREFMDLDLTTSLKIAESLSVEFLGKPEQALADFVTLSEWCGQDKGLNLPLPICAQLAARVSKKGEKFEQGLADSFKEVFHFLKQHEATKGIGLKQALQLSESVATTSPQAVANFKEALVFGLSQKGLELPADRALRFAEVLAIRTRQEGLPAKERWPASKSPYDK